MLLTSLGRAWQCNKYEMKIVLTSVDRTAMSEPTIQRRYGAQKMLGNNKPPVCRLLLWCIIFPLMNLVSEACSQLKNIK